MDMMALAAVGVTAALCGVVVRQKAPELAAVLTLAACVLLLWNTLPLLETIRDVLTELADLAELSPTILRPMLQTVGLAVVTRLASSLCRDAGESALASVIETAGTVCALLVAVPLFRTVLRTLLELMNG